MSSRSRIFLTAPLIFLVSVVSLYLIHAFYLPRNGSTVNAGLCASNSITSIGPSLSTIPQKRRRVAIASKFSYHHDVYMSLAWTLAQAMDESSTVEVYADVPFNYDFGNIVDELHLYSHEYRDPDDLLPAIRMQMGDGGIDMVILGTCEGDLRGDWTKDLLSIWDERDDDHKFQLVCIVHNIKDTAWQPAITEWSRRDAIRLITISEHVAYSFRESFRATADSTDPIIQSAGYENIKVDVHVPVLALPDLPERPHSRALSKAVIQGSFDTVRRDYNHIFQDLNTSFYEDPKSWGYLPLGDQPSYVADLSHKDPPFQLYLIGSGHLDIPEELKNVITMHARLSYPDFYKLMSEMDICLPAFAENGYYHMQASSTFAMAVECNVPILVTERTRRSYVYADDDRAVVTRPAAMREVAALRVLRTGDASHFLGANMPNTQMKMEANIPIRNAVQDMMRRGWTRRKRDLEDFKTGLWRRNIVVSERLLRDL